MKRLKPIALAIATLCATSTWADTIDINALIVDQLKKTGKLAAIYGGPVPQDVNTSVVYEGAIGGRGLKISTTGPVPARPVVLLEEPVACSPVAGSYTAEATGETTDSTSFSQTDKVETKQELAVTLGYESPFGASASTTMTLGQTRGSETSKGGSTTKARSWKSSRTIEIPPNRSFTVQYVVTEKYLDAVPFTANLVLSGDVSLNFLRGQEGFSWVKIAGTNLPKNVIRPGFQQGNRRLAVCRTYQNNRMRIGKSEGTTCWFGLHEFAPMAAMVGGGGISGKSTGDFEILVGADSSVQLSSDVYLPDAYVSDDPSHQKVCFAMHNGWELPGYIEGRNCVSEWDSRAVITPTYKVLRVPQTGGLVKRARLDDHLTLDQRTFNLRGTFSGVQAVRGEMVISEGPSCPATVRAAGASASAAATHAPGPPKKLVMTAAKPNARVLPGGKVLGTDAPK